MIKRFTDFRQVIILADSVCSRVFKDLQSGSLACTGGDLLRPSPTQVLLQGETSPCSVNIYCFILFNIHKTLFLAPISVLENR